MYTSTNRPICQYKTHIDTCRHISGSHIDTHKAIKKQLSHLNATYKVINQLNQVPLTITTTIPTNMIY